MDSDINYIIQESLNGDKNYQEILLKKLNPLLFKNIYMYWNFGSPIEADLLHEGYLLILESLNNFDKNRNVHFLQYAKINAKYFYKNYYKKNKTHAISLSITEFYKIADNSLNTLESAIKKEEYEQLIANINKLNEKEKQVIYLYYYKDLSLSEISKKLNVPYRTLLGRKKTALKKLKKFFRR